LARSPVSPVSMFRAKKRKDLHRLDSTCLTKRIGTGGQVLDGIALPVAGPL